MSASTLVFAIALVTSPGGEDPEWGGFRGNNGVGVSATSALPDALDREANAAWRIEIPNGYSSPIVSGGHVYLTGSDEDELFTMCVDRADGEVLWRAAVGYDGKRPGMNSPAAPSPVTDSERIYVVFHSIGLVAYDLDGEELWRKELGPFNIPHGMATSPLVHGDVVVLLADQDTDGYLAAFDKRTGEERWKVARPGITHSYSTPAIFEPAEGPAQVIVSGALQVVGYSIEDGKRLWWADGSSWQTKAVPVFAGDLCIINAYMVPSTEFGFPKFSQTWEEALAERDEDGDGKIAKNEWDNSALHMAWFIFDLDGDDLLGEEDYDYAVSSQRATGGLYAVKPGGEGDVTESHVAWTYEDRRGLPDCPSPLVFGDTLFMVKEGGLFTAMDPTNGEIVKQGRIGEPDRYYASPVAADGKILTASASGQLAVLSGDREWEVISVSDLGESVWATPAIADGQVFVRSSEALYCFEDLSQE